MLPMPADAWIDRALLGYSGGHCLALTLIVSGQKRVTFRCWLVAAWSASGPPSGTDFMSCTRGPAVLVNKLQAIGAGHVA